MPDSYVLKTKTAKFNRTAAVTDYPAFRLITDDNLFTLSLDVSDRAVYLRRVTIMCNALPGNPTLALHLFNSEPPLISTADYAGIALASSQLTGVYEGRFTQAASGHSGIVQYEFSAISSLNLGITSPEGTLYGAIETQAAIVAPPASLQFRIRAVIEYSN